MPKLSQRQIQGQNSRDKLLDAATRLFHENGYQAVTVNDICEAAQLTKAHFIIILTAKKPFISICIPRSWTLTSPHIFHFPKMRTEKRFCSR